MEGNPAPVPRRPDATRSFSGPMPPDPTAAPEVLERFNKLVHEMASLLDGSLRWLGLAHRTIDQARNPTSGNDLPAEDALDQASWQIETARGALERMADLVHAAMQSAGLPLGSRLLVSTQPVGLLDALSHAARVIAPEAGDRGVTIHVDVHPTLRSTPAGALYAVVLNALRNALESICVIQQPIPTGRIEVLAAPGPAAGCYTLEIRDDGVGPPVVDQPDRVFDPGFSTKPRGSGIGLSMASSIVREAGGTISLSVRPPGLPNFSTDPRRPGALLRIVMPDQSRDLDSMVGQEHRQHGSDAA